MFEGLYIVHMNLKRIKLLLFWTYMLEIIKKTKQPKRPVGHYGRRSAVPVVVSGSAGLCKRTSAYRAVLACARELAHPMHAGKIGSCKPS